MSGEANQSSDFVVSVDMINAIHTALTTLANTLQTLMTAKSTPLANSVPTTSYCKVLVGQTREGDHLAAFQAKANGAAVRSTVGGKQLEKGGNSQIKIPSKGESGHIATGEINRDRVLKRGCFRCGEIGHFVGECRNALVCFTCGRLGHLSNRCQAVLEHTLIQEPTPRLNQEPSQSTSNSLIYQITPQISDPLFSQEPPPPSQAQTEAIMVTDEVLHFENTPLSDSLEEGFKRSVIIKDQDQIGRERIMAALRSIAPQFHWKVAEFREGEVLVDGPG